MQMMSFCESYETIHEGRKIQRRKTRKIRNQKSAKFISNRNFKLRYGQTFYELLNNFTWKFIKIEDTLQE